MLTLGAYVGPVTHHMAPVVRRTLDPTLGERLSELELQDTDYEGRRLSSRRCCTRRRLAASPRPACGWPRRPTCRPAIRSRRWRSSRQLAKSPRLPLEIDRLREVADSFLHDVEAALEEHPELAEQLKRNARG